ncbi:MAG: hypothetical protein E6R03_08300 [Hyphomicrobiaceae bacterium]|nr:MAG: hypothetical protein E6R03_08300 [Hyphomicrobiaceae bacterium]
MEDPKPTEEVVADRSDVCLKPDCPTCVMVRNTLLAFESAVLLTQFELEKEQPSFQKIDLSFGVATDLGSAFARLDQRCDLSKVAVKDASKRFLAAATLMNRSYESLKSLQMMAKIASVN